MKRILIALLACAFFALPAQQAAAQRGGGSKPKPPAPSKPTAPKVNAHGGGPKVSAPKPPKSPSSGGPKKMTPSSGATGKPAKATTKTADGSTKAGKRATVTSAGTTTQGLTPVQQKLQRNTQLADKLQRRLPPGTDLVAAADGFTKLGHFVSAVNVSNNLGIPFVELKSRILDDGMSLGQAIQASKTTADASIEARRAEADAQRLIAETDAAPPPTTAATKTKAKKRTSGGLR